PRLTVAHGVMLSEDEIALLAERVVTVALNTSSNLRLRSGIAPVDLYQKRGLAFAIGLDGMAPDDDDDILREARLAYQLHRGFGGRDGLGAADLFRALWRNGRPTLGLGPADTLLSEGAPADILVLDANALAADILPGAVDPATILTHRMMRDAVRDLYVGGRQVVSDGVVKSVDVPTLETAFFAEARAQWMKAPPDIGMVAARREATVNHYRDGAHRTASLVRAN
ncbi:MAG: amidohydrolase family protein, partial [Pseudomonadota bacterium]